jgi:hypothetical protein
MYSRIAASVLLVSSMSTVACTNATREISVNSASMEGRDHGIPQNSLTKLTAREISSIGAESAYDAISRLRPSYLGSEHMATLTDVVRYEPDVLVDGNWRGNTDILRSIAAADVLELAYMQPRDAIVRLGPRYRSGVILVRLIQRVRD